MAYITKAELSNVARTRAGYSGVRAMVSDSKSSSRYLQKTSLFLSHSHSDKETVEEAVVFFRTLGINIYVDWMDDAMSSSPTGVTAERIKVKIKENDKFVLLATNAAVTSKWCNWEVGIGDVNKFASKKLALLPLADNNGTWLGSEYLQIYPRIEQIQGSYYVYSPDKSFETLSTWVQR